MQQHTLMPRKGAKRSRKRVGRGDASGSGSYSGRGMKGQNARTGGGVRLGFEGGQNPLIKKLPMMRGFTNIFRQKYQIVNLSNFGEFPANTQVTIGLLVDTGLIKHGKGPVKVLGRGEIEIPLEIEAHKFSRSAREKIEKAGGSVRMKV